MCTYCIYSQVKIKICNISAIRILLFRLQAKLFIFSKLVSAVQNLPGAFKSLLDILRHASPGALFLFIDNAHVQTKSFIQDLVFPNRCFTDHKTYKESDSFRLYTTYAELKSDCEEPLKSSVQCECLGLVNHWLDRDPILDLRVNVMLAIKKSSRWVPKGLGWLLCAGVGSAWVRLQGSSFLSCKKISGQMQREVQGLIPDQICMVSFKLEKRHRFSTRMIQNFSDFFGDLWWSVIFLCK